MTPTQLQAEVMEFASLLQHYRDLLIRAAGLLAQGKVSEARSLNSQLQQTQDALQAMHAGAVGMALGRSEAREKTT